MTPTNVTPKVKTVEQIARKIEADLPYQIVLSKVDGVYRELTYELEGDETVVLLDNRNYVANMAYQQSLTLVLMKAVKDTLGEEYSIEALCPIAKGIYIKIKYTDKETGLEKYYVPAPKKVYELYTVMTEIIEADLPITNEGDDIRGIGDVKGTFYRQMVPSTGYLKLFELWQYEKGVILRVPYTSNPNEIPEFVYDSKLYAAFKDSREWQKLVGIKNIGDINRIIRNNGARDLILLNEAIQEKRISDIADKIVEGGKRLVLIAGPSSSGKTTFAKRLCIQLRAAGAKTLYMGTDDYFRERDELVPDENGKLDFESLTAMDLELFNRDMNDLIAGKEVDIPTFNFITGKKSFGSRLTTIDSETVIVVEGIHALNEVMTQQIPHSSKYKVYISPLHQMNADDLNRISTTDARLLRRMVRDFKYRGYGADNTLSKWQDVRDGEDVNIFPYNGEADVHFNSALVYELPIIKKYAEPLLKDIKPDNPTYCDAVRLLDFLNFIEVIDNEDDVPNNSIMREFIGGSVFVE